MSLCGEKIRYSSLFRKTEVLVTIGTVYYALISGHPGGVTPGNPRAFAPRHLQIPLTQGQYSSTKSYHCPPPGEHNLKGLPNCNVIS